MRGFAAIGLHEPKDSKNIGATLRAAGCYGASMVAASGYRYRGSCLDTRAQHKHMPLITTKSGEILTCKPHHSKIIAIDLIEGATPLFEFKHPSSAYYIFGPEDGTLGADILDRADEVVYIPTDRCMNLAATVNVVLYDRMLKANYEVSKN